MAIKEYFPNNIIDLSREEGNVFSLIAVALRLAKEFGKDGKAISAEMIKTDYGNAVYVFNREFGDFVDVKLPACMNASAVKNSYLKANNNPDNMQEAYLR